MAMKLLALVENINKETFQDHDLEFRVAVNDLLIAVQRAQPVLTANLRIVPQAVAESMETDDEGDPSLFPRSSRHIFCFISILELGPQAGHEAYIFR